jgi:hypothetical protein
MTLKKIRDAQQIDNVRIAKQLIKIADFLEEEEEIDPRFVDKIRSLKIQLPRLVRKKNRKLIQFGIGVIRPNAKVEDLIDALMTVVQS